MKNPNSFYSFGNEPEPIIEDSEKPLSYAEHMRQMQQETQQETQQEMQQENVVEDFLKNNRPADEEVSEVFHSSSEAPLSENPTPEKLRRWEAQEIEDWSFVYSVCTEEQANEIMYSDEYGEINKNGLRMEDLMDSDAMFGVQYYGDGYPTYDSEFGGIATSRREDAELTRRFDGNIYLEVGRGQQIIEAVDIVANHYCKDKTAEQIDMFKGIVEKRAYQNRQIDALERRQTLSREEKEQLRQLTEEETEFLKQDLNPVSERLLYGPKSTTRERADDISSAITDRAERFSKALEECSMETDEKRKHSREKDVRSDYATGLYYSVHSIEDYVEAGKIDLIADARKKLSDEVDKHFEDIVKFVDETPGPLDRPSESALLDVGDLILEYSDPYKLIDRAIEYDLVEKDIIEDPDEIVAAIRRRDDYSGKFTEQIYFSEHTNELKELGVSDEAIVGDFVYDIGDFLEKEDTIITNEDMAGTQFLKAGVDKKTLLRQVYCENLMPFKEADFNHKTCVDIFERNGITATEAAQTFSPDCISGENLQKFIERGADAKELMKYMMSYSETFEEGRHVDKNGEEENDFIYRSGIQKIRVRDKNRPKGIIVEKEMMPYADGKLYVAANIDTFAKAGVTAKEIFESMESVSPHSPMIQAMIESRQFNIGTVLEEAYKRNSAVNDYSQSEYYAKVIESLESNSKEREGKLISIIDRIREDFPNKQ